MECILIALGLLCWDGVKSPGADNSACKIEKEAGYIACLNYPNCSMHGAKLAYISESYIIKNKVQWCENIAKDKKVKQ